MSNRKIKKEQRKSMIEKSMENTKCGFTESIAFIDKHESAHDFSG